MRRIVMLTGDRADAAKTIGAALDIDAVLADRTPSDKVDAVVGEQRARPTIMVGDGINDAPALAAASIGVAMGARGASAASEAASVAILVDRLDRVSDAVAIARRTRRIALESIVVGMALSGTAMLAAAFGLLSPIAGALTQEVIDVAVILNALRALAPAPNWSGPRLSGSSARALHERHERMTSSLDRLREIADHLDGATPEQARELIAQASHIVDRDILEHERHDETVVYPRLGRNLKTQHGLSALSRAHREILHLARLLARIAAEVGVDNADHTIVRDASVSSRRSKPWSACTMPRKRTSTTMRSKDDVFGIGAVLQSCFGQARRCCRDVPDKWLVLQNSKLRRIPLSMRVSQRSRI